MVVRPVNSYKLKCLCNNNASSIIRQMTEINVTLVWLVIKYITLVCRTVHLLCRIKSNNNTVLIFKEFSI